METTTELPLCTDGSQQRWGSRSALPITVPSWLRALGLVFRSGCANSACSVPVSQPTGLVLWRPFSGPPYYQAPWLLSTVLNIGTYVRARVVAEAPRADWGALYHCCVSWAAIVLVHSYGLLGYLSLSQPTEVFLWSLPSSDHLWLS